MDRKELNKLKDAEAILCKWLEIPAVAEAYQHVIEVMQTLQKEVEESEELSRMFKEFDRLREKKNPAITSGPPKEYTIDRIWESIRKAEEKSPPILKGCPNAGNPCFCPGTCMEPIDTENMTASEIYIRQAQKEIEANKEDNAQKLWKVNIIEAERGWGRSVEGVRWFATREEGEAFVKDYNKDLPSVAPDYYWQAEGPYYVG